MEKKLRESSVHIMTAQFKLMPADPALVSSIQQELGLPHFAARTMVAHGVNSLEEARAFLAPDIERDWLNPYTIPQLGAAVDRLSARCATTNALWYSAISTSMASLPLRCSRVACNFSGPMPRPSFRSVLKKATA